MTPFFDNDVFFDNLHDYISYLQISKEDILDEDEDWYASVQLAEEKPACKLTAEGLALILAEYSEQSNEHHAVTIVKPLDMSGLVEYLIQTIDLNKVVSFLPTAYFPGESERIDRMDFIKELNISVPKTNSRFYEYE